MRLFLECKPDQTLAVALGFPEKDVVHSHGKGRVSNYLSKHQGVIGLVDGDFGSSEPRGLKDYVEKRHEHGVRLRTNPNRENRLIVLCPRLEPWLIQAAKTSGVKMETFGLPEKLHDLDALINQRLPNVGRLVEELLRRNNPAICFLQSLFTAGGPPPSGSVRGAGGNFLPERRRSGVDE
jgi:hypothetical protein